ncbi:DUF255 domain-containing protein [Halococcus saccharolyticus]|uniref:Spermatogenesis-associated protein 20-like TRX domain-containing protein n=1 Tax=Halococcus saccharolyticus DSM 5350 TaxID=1227455 RepID=M0MM93_9EURY|nr:DUF255 domain-containing protein [Halococcus saccharolyticus]EMA45859.1 hypothetical protein C449_06346 [Halococcus saccharolyticus DSM 5350]
MDAGAVDTLVEWREWGAAAFDEARERDAPILCNLRAHWCRECREMDRTAYASPTVAANLNDGFVPVRVDVDRRPRVRERYNMGGFPSTVFLTPSGELITGATYLGADGLRQVLERVRTAWNENGEEAGRVPRELRDADPPAGALSPAIEAHMEREIAAAFDEEFGGWGTGPKFPLAPAIEFALTRDPDRAFRTLEAIRTHLHDTYAGGFFRYAVERDWGDRQTEKTLDTNAGLCRTFAAAARYDDEYADPAVRTAEFLTTTLASGDGFAASQAGDEAYYGLPPSDREAADSPPIDDTVLAGANGLAIDALLETHAVIGHEGARRGAERGLSQLLDSLVEDGRVLHYRDGNTAGPHGVLADQARVLGALTSAVQVLGDDWLAPAERIAEYTIAERREGDSFLDGPEDGSGLLSRPLRPLGTNVTIADALYELGVLTGEDRYHEIARETLAAFAGAHDRLGIEVAGYATTAARVLSGTEIAVAAPLDSPLHRAALDIPDHEAVVIPDVDGESDTARITIDGESTMVSAPAELHEHVAGE